MSHSGLSELLCEWGLPSSYIKESKGCFGLVDGEGHCHIIIQMSEAAHEEATSKKGGFFALALVYHPEKPEGMHLH